MNRIASSLTACTLANLIVGSALAVDLPYTSGKGDPLGLTSSWNPAMLIESMCEPDAPALHLEVPYSNGKGDPSGLTSSNRHPGGKQVSYFDFCATGDHN